MTNEQGLLLKLISKALFSRNIDQNEFTDWDGVFNEAKAQSVFLLAYQTADRSVVPEETINKWKNNAGAALVNNVMVIKNHVRIDEWMTKAGIPYVILKGCASANYYPDPTLRAMGDVDFLVPTECVKAAGNILEDKGFHSEDNGHPAHIGYYDRSGVYELHFKVTGIPENDVGRRIHDLLSDIHAKASRKSVVFGSAVLPSDFHHGLAMLVHTCCHITSGGIGLRHLCDWAVFVNSFSEEEFTDIFEEKLKSVGLWKFAEALSLASIKYLGADDKGFAHECGDSIAEGLIEDILSGGNFGRKDENRMMQSSLISSRNEIDVDKSKGMFGQYFRSKVEMVGIRWPAARRHKILLPAGFVYFGAARLIGILTGKRKRQFSHEIVDGAATRKKLYSSLEFYKLS